ncbi:hypothetical protein LTR50_002296 [Elasticomyces elasticus]|nr:hypothetical protein LTR50_002296 [Elasticomyces elasticus]
MTSTDMALLINSSLFGSDGNSDSDVNSVSTEASAPKSAYDVDEILAEIPTEDGIKHLVKWTGYPVLRSTWEPVESFNDVELLQEWRKKQDRINRGLIEPFDMEKFYEEVEADNAKTTRRKEKRKRKRLQLELLIDTKAQQSVHGEPRSRVSSEAGGDAKQVEGQNKQHVRKEVQLIRWSSESEAEEAAPPVRQCKGVARPVKRPTLNPTKILSANHGTAGASEASVDSLIEEHRGISKPEKPPAQNTSRGPNSESIQKHASHVVPTTATQIKRKARRAPSIETAERLRDVAAQRPPRRTSASNMHQAKKTGSAIFANWDAPVQKRQRYRMDETAPRDPSAPQFVNLSRRSKFQSYKGGDLDAGTLNLPSFDPATGNMKAPTNVKSGEPQDQTTTALLSKAVGSAALGAPVTATVPPASIASTMTVTAAPAALATQVREVPPQDLSPPLTPAGPSQDPKMYTCWFWAHSGYCKFEDGCNFAHRYTGQMATRKQAVKLASSKRASGKQVSGKQGSSKRALKPRKKTCYWWANGGCRYVALVLDQIDFYSRSPATFPAADASAILSDGNRIASNINDVLTLTRYSQDECEFLHEQLAEEAGAPGTWSQSRATLPPSLPPTTSSPPPPLPPDPAPRSPSPQPPLTTTDDEQSVRITVPLPPLSDIERSVMASTMKPGESHEEVVGRLFLGVDKERFFQGPGGKPTEKVAILLFHPRHVAEINVLTKVLHAMGAKVYHGFVAGSWDYFCHRYPSGVVLIHPEIYNYHKIPSMRRVLLNGKYNIFQIGVDATLDVGIPAAVTRYSCTRLFPFGKLILITDDVFVYHPHKARRILQTITNTAYHGALQGTKLVARPGIRNWLISLLDRSLDEWKEPKEMYEARCKLFMAYRDLVPLTDGDTFWGVENPGRKALCISAPKDHLPSFVGQWETSEATATDNLVHWFAGEAIKRRLEFRRFYVAYEPKDGFQKVETTDKRGNKVMRDNVDPREWGKMWKHLEIGSPEGVIDTLNHPRK